MFTSKQVEHAKPEDKRREIPAGPPSGLYLVLHPSGKKTWAFRYRFRGKTEKVDVRSVLSRDDPGRRAR